jgi:hypothetical protein
MPLMSHDHMVEQIPLVMEADQRFGEAQFA